MSPRRLRITGRVQGVGFRWFVREAAQELGLAGWVRNDPDGSVVIAMAGAPDSERALVAAVSRGPSGSRVDAVQDLPAEPMEPPMMKPFRVVNRGELR